MQLNLKTKHIRCWTFLLLFFFVLSSCSDRPKGVLNKSDMTDFLVDLHKLDGVLDVKGLGSAQDRENLYYYNALLKKYGISAAQFDSSLAWYSKNPKSFEKIYANVYDRLENLDSLQLQEMADLQKLQAYKESSYNIWNNRNKLVINQDSLLAKGLTFGIKNQTFYEKDLYKLSLLLRSSGKIKNQYIVFRIHYKGGLKDSVQTKVITDSVLRRYTLMLRAKRTEKIDSLTGVICKLNPGKEKFKTRMDSIQLMRVYIPAVQDSLIKVQQVIKNKELGIKEPTLRNKVLRYRKPTRQQQLQIPL